VILSRTGTEVVTSFWINFFFGFLFSSFSYGWEISEKFVPLWRAEIWTNDRSVDSERLFTIQFFFGLLSPRHYVDPFTAAQERSEKLPVHFGFNLINLCILFFNNHNRNNWIESPGFLRIVLWNLSNMSRRLTTSFEIPPINSNLGVRPGKSGNDPSSLSRSNDTAYRADQFWECSLHNSLVLSLLTCELITHLSRFPVNSLGFLRGQLKSKWKLEGWDRRHFDTNGPEVNGLTGITLTGRQSRASMTRENEESDSHRRYTRLCFGIKSESTGVTMLWTSEKWFMMNPQISTRKPNISGVQ
jgi:hypothetical protein